MRALLSLVVFCLGLAPVSAQPVEWQWLEGPFSDSSGEIVADTAGVIYWSRHRDGGSDLLRSTDGLSWESTAYPGSRIRRISVGAGGRLLVAAAGGAFIGTQQGDIWAHAGLAAQDIRHIFEGDEGPLFAHIGGGTEVCGVVWSADDGTSWHSFDLDGLPFTCPHAAIATPEGGLLVAGHAHWSESAIAWAEAPGAEWQWSIPGGRLGLLVGGQHGGIFAIAPPEDNMFGPYFGPYVHVWQGGYWDTLSRNHASGVTTRADGSTVIGFADGRMSGVEDLNVAGPLHMVNTADGDLHVSTSTAGRWRYRHSQGWRQVAGPAANIRRIITRNGEVYAGVATNVLRHDTERWRGTAWTRNTPHAMDFYGDDLWVASGGFAVPFPLPSGSGFPNLGVWKADSSTAFAIADYCDHGHCAAAALVVGDSIALASHIGEDGGDYFGPGLGVVRSADGGKTWEPVIPDVGTIYHLAGNLARGFVAASGPDYVGWGEPAERFYRSEDGGLTWMVITEGLPPSETQSLAMGPDGTAYLGIRSAGVYRLDSDERWRTVGPEGEDFASLATNSNGEVALAVDGELRIYDGVNWLWPTTPADGVHLVHFDESDILYVATNQGIFRTATAFIVQSEDEALAQTASFTTYPNPLSRAGFARLVLAQPETITITLYDLLGRRVSVLADGAYEAGSHDVPISVAGLAMGIYLIELRTDVRREVKPMTVVAP